MAAALVLASQACAAEVYAHLSSARVADMLKAAGALDIEITKPEAGTEIVSFSDGKGPVEFILMDCTAEGCALMQMDATFEKNDAVTVTTVNAFNQGYLNVQAVYLADGGVALRRLFIAAGGFTEDNLKANSAVFLTAINLWEKHAASQLVASRETQTAKLAQPAKPLAFDAPLKTTLAPLAAKWLVTRRRRTLPH